MAVVDPTTSRQQYDDFYRRSLDDPEGFWLEAAEALDWSVPATRAFEQLSPLTFTWFPGGRTNLTVNALDRHVAAGDGGRVALIALDERGGRRAVTYAERLGRGGTWPGGRA